MRLLGRRVKERGTANESVAIAALEGNREALVEIT